MKIAAVCFLLSPLYCSPCYKLWFKVSASSTPPSPPLSSLREETGRIGPYFLLSVERHLNRPCYWPHPPREGVGQCSREQGTILDHLTIISKCTPVTISAGPPWECFVLLTALSAFYSAPQEPCNANSTPHTQFNNGKGGGRCAVSCCCPYWRFYFFIFCKQLNP